MSKFTEIENDKWGRSDNFVSHWASKGVDKERTVSIILGNYESQNQYDYHGFYHLTWKDFYVYLTENEI